MITASGIAPADRVSPLGRFFIAFEAFMTSGRVTQFDISVAGDFLGTHKQDHQSITFIDQNPVRFDAFGDDR